MITRKAARLIADGCIRVFSNSNHRISFRDLSNFIYDEGYEDWFWNIFETSNTEELVRKRIMHLHTGNTFRWFNIPVEDADKTGQEFLVRLAESVLKHFEDNSPQLSHAKELVQSLTAQLELDGYMYVRKRLYPTERSIVDEQAEQSYLELLVEESNLQDKLTITHHLDLSEQAYAEDRWSDTISNARNFLEAILGQIADALSVKATGAPLSASIATKPFKTREYLETQGLIDGHEKEALSKIYGLISNTGSHPNIAEKAQARLMRNLALTFSQYILLQWQGYLKNNS